MFIIYKKVLVEDDSNYTEATPSFKIIYTLQFVSWFFILGRVYNLM